MFREGPPKILLVGIVLGRRFCRMCLNTEVYDRCIPCHSWRWHLLAYSGAQQATGMRLEQYTGGGIGCDQPRITRHWMPWSGVMAEVVAAGSEDEVFGGQYGDATSRKDREEPDDAASPTNAQGASWMAS